MHNNKISITDIYSRLDFIQEITQSSFSIEFCKRSRGYMSMIKSKKLNITTDVMLNICAKIDELLSENKHLTKDNISVLETLSDDIKIAIKSKFTEGQRIDLQKFFRKIVDQINNERGDTMRHISIGF